MRAHAPHAPRVPLRPASVSDDQLAGVDCVHVAVEAQKFGDAHCKFGLEAHDLTCVACRRTITLFQVHRRPRVCPRRGRSHQQLPGEKCQHESGGHLEHGAGRHCRCGRMLLVEALGLGRELESAYCWWLASFAMMWVQSLGSYLLERGGS